MLLYTILSISIDFFLAVGYNCGVRWVPVQLVLPGAMLVKYCVTFKLLARMHGSVWLAVCHLHFLGPSFLLCEK